MKQKLIVGILIGISLIGCGRKSEPIIRPVEAVSATISPEALVYEYPAVITADKEAPVAFRVAGPIKTMKVDVGSFVKAGDVIAEMDKRDYEIQLDAFKEKVVAAKNVYEASKAVADNARKQFSRVETLYREKAVPKKTYDEALAGVQAAAAAELANLAQYQGAVQGMTNCENQLNDTVLKAPYDAYVSRKYFDTGAVVDAGLPVVSLASLGNNKVKISVSEEDLVKMKNLSEARLSYKGKDYKLNLVDAGQVKGTLKLVYPVTFQFDKTESENNIPVDSEGIVKISFKNENDKGILIPIESVFEKNGVIKVWVYSDNQVNEKEIKIVKPYSDGLVMVTGIDEGQKIVTKGVHELTEGQKVNLLEPFSKTNVGDML